MVKDGNVIYMYKRVEVTNEDEVLLRAALALNIQRLQDQQQQLTRRVEGVLSGLITRQFRKKRK